MKKNPDLARPEQIEALRKMGIDPPSTRAGCRNLLDWITRGGPTSAERAAMIVAAQGITGKRVRTKPPLKPRTGRVRFLQAKTPERLLLRATSLRDISTPLDAFVHWDEKGAFLVSLGLLEVIPEETT